jgi:ABC-type Fe3+/spermidine/putrescine transport system ATPase subunit
MTTADLICVMNAGKIEQRAQPRKSTTAASEFVARFIGMSNVLQEARRWTTAGFVAGVRCASPRPDGRCRDAVSIRQHQIALWPGTRDKDNVVPAR